MLGRRLRRRPNIQPTLGQRLVFVETNAGSNVGQRLLNLPDFVAILDRHFSLVFWGFTSHLDMREKSNNRIDHSFVIVSGVLICAVNDAT